MTDRELLEMAAKAAKIEICGWEGTFAAKIECPEGGWDYWNPLADDRDALRLAVKLGTTVAPYKDPDETWCSVGINPGVKEPHGNNPHAATRRAIVRAAAEIGRTTP